jgi:hypothetical protein
MKFWLFMLGFWSAIVLAGSVVAIWAIRRNRRIAAERLNMLRWLGSDFRK